MTTLEQNRRNIAARYPDPADAVAHTLAVYADEPDDSLIIVATLNIYGEGVRTGLTWGDLRRLVAASATAAPPELACRCDRLDHPHPRYWTCPPAPSGGESA